jgi:lysophospholipase L1-like esterase
MPIQDYFESTIAYDPDSENLVASATFAVYAVDDTTFATPLALTYPASGASITALTSTNIGVLPAFRAEGDPDQVILKSGAFTTLLTSKFGAVKEAGLDAATVQAAIASEAAAAEARAGAEAARDTAESALASLQAVEATNDSIMTAVAGDPESEFAVQQRATIGEGVEAEGNTRFQRRDYASIVFAGDSNTANGGGPGMHISYRPGSFYPWAMVMLGHRLNVLRNAGVGGDTSTQLLVRFDSDVIAYAPAWVHILIGTNDAGASAVAVALATTQANILEMIERCRAIGARIILGTVPPRNDRTGASATHALSLNGWIRRLPLTNPDVIVVDYHAILSNPTSADDWITGYGMDDGVHFKGKGGSIAGKLLADTLRPLVPDLAQVGRTTTDPSNLLAAQCQWTGAGAGVAPSGWTASNAAYITGLVPRTDGIPGNWLEVVVPADQSWTLARNGDPVIAVGEAGWFAVEFEATGLQATPTTQYLSADFNVPSGILPAAMSHVSGASGDPVHGDLARSGVLKTPVYTRLVEDTTMRPLITIAGGGTYRFACPSVFKA